MYDLEEVFGIVVGLALWAAAFGVVAHFVLKYW